MSLPGSTRLLALPAFLTGLLLSGCATLSESQCVAGDWESVGYRDGHSGHPSTRLLEHQNACVKHGVVPDREAYLAGWDQGVRQYCQPENGFNAGRSGAPFANVCPAEMQAPYHAAYQEGRELYLAQSEIDSLRQQIARNGYRLKEIARELAAAETRLVEEDMPALERRELLNRTRALAQEQGRLETEIQQMKVDVALLTEHLNSYRQTLAYAY